MNEKKRIVWPLLAVAAFVAGLSCSPASRKAIVDAAPGVERATCVILRATSPSAEDVCATADELTPFVDDLLKQLLAARAVEGPPPGPQVAFALTPPTRKRAAAKRHCAAWVPVTPLIDAGLVEPADGGQDSGR